jgi:hypothetical protein
LILILIFGSGLSFYIFSTELTVDGSLASTMASRLIAPERWYTTLRRTSALSGPNTSQMTTHLDCCRIQRRSDSTSRATEPNTFVRVNTTVIAQPEIEQHPYQLQEEWDPVERITNVRYWTDFRRVDFHPRSLLTLDASASPTPLSSYKTGLDWWSSASEIVEGDFHFFAEECDQMQGVVMYVGIENAWGTFGAEYAERLRDELGTKSIWVWAVGESGSVRLYVYCHHLKDPNVDA